METDLATYDEICRHWRKIFYIITQKRCCDIVLPTHHLLYVSNLFQAHNVKCFACSAIYCPTWHEKINLSFPECKKPSYRKQHISSLTPSSLSCLVRFAISYLLHLRAKQVMGLLKKPESLFNLASQGQWDGKRRETSKIPLFRVALKWKLIFANNETFLLKWQKF